MATIFAFVKLFDKQEYADAFMQGKLFMNTIRSFKEYTDECRELRGDTYEGITALYQPTQISDFRIGNIHIPADDLAAPIVIQSDHLLNHNVFCLYSVNSGEYTELTAEILTEFKRTLEVHHACFGLGKYCVVICNVQEFLNRCDQAIQQLNVEARRGKVTYFDEHTYHGEMEEDNLGFHKRNLFAHQHEYRIRLDLRREPSTAFILEIGDLSDIAKQMTPEEFNEGLKIQLPDGTTA